MAIPTTGSLVYGLVDGLGKSMVGSVTGPRIYYVLGNPDGLLTQYDPLGSDIAVDATNGKYYIGKAGSPLCGSTWYNLGSKT